MDLRAFQSIRDLLEVCTALTEAYGDVVAERGALAAAYSQLQQRHQVAEQRAIELEAQLTTERAARQWETQDAAAVNGKAHAITAGEPRG